MYHVLLSVPSRIGFDMNYEHWYITVLDVQAVRRCGTLHRPDCAERKENVYSIGGGIDYSQRDINKEVRKSSAVALKHSL